MIDNEYQKHTGTEMPSDLAEAQIIIAVGLVPKGYQEQWKGPAGVVPWEDVTLYALFTDMEGIPYCSAEGLESWAEYVATEGPMDFREHNQAFQFEAKPVFERHSDCEDMWLEQPETIAGKAPTSHCKPGNPANSLMRVWR